MLRFWHDSEEPIGSKKVRSWGVKRTCEARR